MAQSPDEIRQAIEETRSEIAGTVSALQEKADVKKRATAKADELAGTVKEKAVELGSKAEEAASKVREAAPERLKPTVASAIDGSRKLAEKAGPTLQQAAGAARSADAGQKRKAAQIAGVVLVLLILRRRRRHRNS